MSFLDEIPLLSYDALKTQLQEISPDVAGFLASNRFDSNNVERSQLVKDWKQWCKAQTKRVKLVEADIPDRILPDKCKGTLVDIKVGGSKYGPDDALYNRSADLRAKVARGNTVLVLHKHETQEIVHDNVIFALKKFTGGMGDEDEQDDNGSDKAWTDYFLKPPSSAVRVVCTVKANGEAAHFSTRWIKDRFVLFAGSKNVHMLFRSKEDIAKYKDSRYLVARTVAESLLNLLSSLEVSHLSTLLSLMHHAHLTAVFEVLQPHYQHVVDLSYLGTESELHFITWTLPYDGEDEGKGAAAADSYCAVAPDAAIDLAAKLGLKCIGYEVIGGGKEVVEERMDAVRRGHGYEGEVLYFMDSRNNVIGLLKKKTAWYVVSRAVREKSAAALLDFKKGRGIDYSHSARAKKMELRLKQIQKWLGFPDEFLEAWTKLGVGFLEWLVVQTKASRLAQDENVRGRFPILWKRYLNEEELTDKVEWKLEK